MNNDENEPLRNLYYFLGNNQSLAKKGSILFGLENYGLNLEPDDFQKIKLDIERKSKNGDITFEDFKSCWEDSKNKESYDTKDINIKLFNLLIEISQPETNTGNNNSSLTANTLDAENIANALEFLNIDINECLNNNVVKDDEFMKIHRYKANEEKNKLPLNGKFSKLQYKMVAQYLVSSIDDDKNGKLTLKEFEVILDNYKRERNLN